MSECLDNLHICKASCCKWIVFTRPGYFTLEMKEYYETHGCVIERINRDLTRIKVPMICPQLDTNTNLCKLHTTGKKPTLCQRQNRENTKSGYFYCTEGCIYGN